MQIQRKTSVDSTRSNFLFFLVMCMYISAAVCEVPTKKLSKLNFYSNLWYIAVNCIYNREDLSNKCFDCLIVREHTRLVKWLWSESIVKEKLNIHPIRVKEHIQDVGLLKKNKRYISDSDAYHINIITLESFSNDYLTFLDV